MRIQAPSVQKRICLIIPARLSLYLAGCWAFITERDRSSPDLLLLKKHRTSSLPLSHTYSGASSEKPPEDTSLKTSTLFLSPILASLSSWCSFWLTRLPCLFYLPTEMLASRGHGVSLWLRIALKTRLSVTKFLTSPHIQEMLDLFGDK